MSPVIRAVEPEACPSLTQGVYEYDFGDTAGLTPLLKASTPEWRCPVCACVRVCARAPAETLKCVGSACNVCCTTARHHPAVLAVCAAWVWPPAHIGPAASQILAPSRTGPLMRRLLQMHTLGSQFIPSPIHAGGLRYHGMSPLISHIYDLGLIEARAVPQNECFAAALKFAQSEVSGDSLGASDWALPVCTGMPRCQLSACQLSASSYASPGRRASCRLQSRRMRLQRRCERRLCASKRLWLCWLPLGLGCATGSAVFLEVVVDEPHACAPTTCHAATLV